MAGGQPTGAPGSGTPITCTLDVSAALVTVLAEQQLNNRTTYVYGLGKCPLASDDGSAWTYLSGRDALINLRQETDAEGQVLAAPYALELDKTFGHNYH